MIHRHAILLLLGTALGISARAANPLDLRLPSGQLVESCADPTVIRGATAGDDAWYLYCTADPLFAGDARRLIPVFRSTDLEHWLYQGDAFAAVPSWGESGSGLWAPEVKFFGGSYHLYYAMTDVKRAISGALGCGFDPAIGVATATSPLGPFVDAGSPVVAPRRSGAGCSFFATIDPEVVLEPSGAKWILYGSYSGGIETRTLSADGLSSEPASASRVAVPDRYEAPEVVRRDGAYWMFASASDCCRGPLTGYTNFVGRSSSPAGPYVDRDGIAMTAGRPGGELALAMNGNRWVGPGHLSVFDDGSGTTWVAYHAIDRDDPYFAGSVGFTKRPAMLDRVVWGADGGPSGRAGWGPSACPQSATPPPYPALAPGAPVAAASDEFDLPTLSPQWSWIRPPASSAWGLENGALRINTTATELYEDNDTAPILVEEAPEGDFVVETRVTLDVPAEGSGWDYVQAGLVLHADDDRYVKLVVASIGSARQVEFANETFPVPAGYPRYGTSVAGPVGDGTWLRMERRAGKVSAWTSLDGARWQRASTWTHDALDGARIGLVAMNRAGFTTRFDHVRVYALGPEPALEAESAPVEVLSVAVSPSAVSWDVVPRADVYDVLRGTLAGIRSGDFGVCLADDVAGTSVGDHEAPAPGAGFTYLVRGVDRDCGGPGTWGSRGIDGGCP